MKYLIIILFIIIPYLSFTQTIKGVVYGNEKSGKEALPGVNIYWQGTKTGVVSGSDGSFEISKNRQQHMLVFSFVGYRQKVVHIDGTEPLEILLEPNLEIEEVTVVHKDRGTYLSRMSPIQTERIGGAELHKAACCNLAESFETNPSVDVSYSDAVTGAKQIRLLGLDGTYSLIQVENMPNLRGLATTFGLTYIPGPWLESIQVSKGAASVLNGYESIAGQINAEIKKPDSQEKLFLNAYRNAHGKSEFNANGNIRVKGDTVTTGLFFHASDLSMRNDENGDGFLDEPLSRQIQFQNRWKINNHKGYMAQVGFGLLTEDRLGGQTGFHKDMARNTLNPYGINIETNRFEAYFKNGYVFPNQRTAIAWLSNFSIHKTNSFYGLTDYVADETRFYGSLIVTRDLDPGARHSINTGASIVTDKYNEEIYNRDFARNEQVPGIFAEYTFKPNPSLTLMTGLRADFHNIFGTFITPRMHFRYKIGEHVTLRSSAGKGYRTANILAENSFMLANFRPLQIVDDVIQEEAWNYGIALVQNYTLLGRELQLNAEYYRTDFRKQLILDRESSADFIILAPLNGKSFANSAQFDIRWQPVNRLDLLLAYRINDVQQTIGGKLMQKPLTSKYKGLINLNYTTNLKKWMFDYTIQFNGGGRIPYYYEDWMSTADMDASFSEFSPYTVMNAQVTKYFRNGSIYLGAENLANFKQKNPVYGADNPYAAGFDATKVWGPILGRKVYLGLRFNLNYK